MQRFFIAFFLIAVNSPVIAQPSDNLSNLTTKVGQFTIEINPTLRVFEVLMHLTGNYVPETNDKGPYKQAIDSYFNNYANHPSVRYCRKLLDHCSADHLIKGLLLNPGYKQDTVIVEYFEGDKNILIDSLKHFIKLFRSQTNFSGFYRENFKHYQDVFHKTVRAVSQKPIIDTIEAFWKAERDSYKIIPVPLEQFPHAYWFENEGKSTTLFFLPSKPKGDISLEDYIYYGAIHEIGHSFLNPLTANLESQIEKINFDYNTYDPTKMDFFNESFLRSLVTVYLERANKKEEVSTVKQQNRKQGYQYNDIFRKYIYKCFEEKDKINEFSDYLEWMVGEMKSNINKK